MIGHGENRCAVRFSMVDDDGSRAWSKELRAEPRRRGGRQTSKWLLDDEGGRSAVQVDSPSSVTGDEQRDPTVSNIPLFSPNHNRQGINSQSLVCSPHVPTASTNKHDLAHLIINQPIIGPIITAHTETLTNQQSSINQEIVQPSTIIPQPPQSINTQDKTLMDHSLPNNTKQSTSFIFSSILTDTLKQKPNHQFSFTASNSSNINQAINPINRTIKINPTQKLNRTTLTRTGTKPVPPKHVPTLHQNSPVSMEVQTEKKRRRDEEKESIDNSAATQHFLMAGPGSQACQDQ
jgi:hypothetical protein